ncbi:GNAT family N-acetyltransferase [Amedibacterium intestinale]|uniref:GNAT family N-acetyltransferase n=1 Tax=Amedibacterium intestinale TaxID=2583452 RepID=UPI000E4E1E94|nr:GNAT family N-acetyltransferase [Amedibacterium intestinale]RHO21788.1 GNAT family N-acetyltransferase [Eubacterium sp. AM18-26]RHO26442.1 GNAT family N-acetyltransferase [Eubacterium sp. AM18-10LB-B]
MIRVAAFSDLNRVEDSHKKHFTYERKNGAFTVFKEGVYPTRQDAETALRNDELYICEIENEYIGIIIFSRKQPIDYESINWKYQTDNSKIAIIHLLMVRPSMKGKGIATELIRFAIDLAKEQGCEVIRLDTGEQNIPAVSLYKKMGFEIAEITSMNVGGAIEHKSHLFMERKIIS